MGRCLGLSMPVERLQKILDTPRLLLNHASGGIQDVAHGFKPGIGYGQPWHFPHIAFSEKLLVGSCKSFGLRISW